MRTCHWTIAEATGFYRHGICTRMYVLDRLKGVLVLIRRLIFVIRIGMIIFGDRQRIGNPGLGLRSAIVISGALEVGASAKIGEALRSGLAFQERDNRFLLSVIRVSSRSRDRV